MDRGHKDQFMACVLGDLFVARVSCLLSDLRIPREPAFSSVERQERRGSWSFQEDILGEHWQGSRHISSKQCSMLRCFPRKIANCISIRSNYTCVTFPLMLTPCITLMWPFIRSFLIPSPIRKFLDFQIKDIDDEYSVELESNSKIKDKLRSCWQQIKPLFLSPNIFKLIAIGMIQLGATIGLVRSTELFFKHIFIIAGSLNSLYHAEYISRVNVREWL